MYKREGSENALELQTVPVGISNVELARAPRRIPDFPERIYTARRPKAIATYASRQT